MSSCNGGGVLVRQSNKIYDQCNCVIYVRDVLLRVKAQEIS